LHFSQQAGYGYLPGVAVEGPKMTVIDINRKSVASVQDGPAANTLCDFLRLHAKQKPDHAAFHCGDAAISWRELEESSTRLARWFLEQGLAPGDRVAVCSLNSIALVQVYFALFKAGLIAVTVNTRLKPDEIRYILDHAQPRMMFCEAVFVPALQEAGVGVPLFSDLAGLTGAQTTALPAVDAELPALIIYTSGTTALPKGVVHSQWSLLQKGLKGMKISAHLPEQVRVTFFPMMHVSGIWFLALAICEGSKTVLLPCFEAGPVLDAIERFGVTTTGGLPTMILSMIEEQTQRPRRVGSLRSVISGGDAVSPALQARFRALFGTELVELYAMTEMTAICVNPTGAIRSGSCGVPLDGIDVRIVDGDGRDVPEGETGEITIRGASAFLAYWNDAEATQAARPDGWLRTGDLGSRDAGGFIWFKGRKKEIIVRAGSKISPQEVEEALYKHPAVLEVGVIGVPDPVNIERVAAYIVLRDGHAATADGLCAFARRHIADYKAPEEIHFLKSLPKNAVGKIQRRALKEMRLAG
jgi:long-chain acyl-CoA synthetase